MKTIKGSIKHALIGSDEEQTLYETVDEVTAAFPNTTTKEVSGMNDCFTPHVGFVKDVTFTDKKPVFIQVYEREVDEFIDGKVDSP